MGALADEAKWKIGCAGKSRAKDTGNEILKGLTTREREASKSNL